MTSGDLGRVSVPATSVVPVSLGMHWHALPTCGRRYIKPRYELLRMERLRSDWSPRSPSHDPLKEGFEAGHKAAVRTFEELSKSLNKHRNRRYYAR
jgi:hypothetical protein